MVISDVRYPQPSRRRLQIYPFDPMLDRGGRVTSVAVTYEPLLPGPSGRLLQVVDYDGTRQRFYRPVDLDDPNVLLQGGLSPNESDPRFHQQMVYAVVMGVLERFEIALGRQLKWRGSDRLRIYPHAFEQRNAYFDPNMGEGGALLFGYFRADADDPGANIPNQVVFTCLSHSIVAHEATHAVLHRLRPNYSQPTNRDVLAFHEGLADIVAMLMPFTYSEVVKGEIASTRGEIGGGDLAAGTALLEMAAQFGFATGKGGPLRSSLQAPDPRRFAQTHEPHARGELLASAVVSGFLRAYRRDANSAIRLATSGSGVLAPGALHPDLVASLVRAAAKAADRLLTMCIRAIDYLPPVDITFGDYIRAVVTADADLFPDDDAGLRAGLIEAFRERGIYPTGATSLADRSVRIEPVAPELARCLTPIEILPEFLLTAMQRYERNSPARVDYEQDDAQGAYHDPIADDSADAKDPLFRPVATRPTEETFAQQLHAWAERNREFLAPHLHPNLPIQVGGFNVSHRYDAEGYLRNIVAVQFLQTDSSADPADWGGLRRRGGVTVIADTLGMVRYIVSRPIPSNQRELDVQNAAIADHLDQLRFTRPGLNWTADPKWVINNFSLAGLDALRF